MIEKVGPYILVGTSHVSKQSIKDIEKAIEEYNPEVIGIELDQQRLKSLYSKEKPKLKDMVKSVGAFGALFAILAGSIQKKIAKNLGVEPGLDMKAGYEIARDKSIPVALIDIPITRTLKKFSNISFFKKFSMMIGLFTKSFKKKYRKKLNFDIKKGVPSEKQIVEVLEIVEKEIPLFYKILIEQRNVHMCKRLKNIKQNHEGYIMAVVGAGHIKGMKEILMKEMMEDTNNFSFSFVTTHD